MYYTQSRMPSSFSNYRKHDSAMERVRQSADRDGEMMSPVDLSIEDATPVQLPPLAWTNYHLTPACMSVRNSGFTVMITADYEGEAPHVSSGPLNGNYVFSQVHFHWGEHNGTGSGHGVDGMRFPLEMHVIHLKRNCANLGEAMQTKDGIAVMVHLFALRAERNPRLDQLTAILQFIQQPKRCARLCPTPLSEIVHPFTSDYFLYWGAVGSPKGRYSILWLVSRDVLPVSAQQMEEFRQLRDSKGNLLMANSSNPYRLGGRSLFLVSPSERTNETMHGVPRQPGHGLVSVEDKDAREILNAEYKSLVALEESGQENCKVCPFPRRVTHIANINVGPRSRVNEGDTSVEESCVDLGDDLDDRLTVTTETNVRESSTNQKVITNVNVTTCRHNYKTSRQPSEVYQVISQRGSELHIKRKPVIVRKKDPSTEQACMFLGNQSTTRTTCSAPSLGSTGGPLAVKQERTNLAHPLVTNHSSEVGITHYDQSRRRLHEDRPAGEYYYSESENETAMRESSRHTKQVVTLRGCQDNDDYYDPRYIDNQQRRVQETPVVKSTVVPAQTDPKQVSEVKPHPTHQGYGGYYEEEEQHVSYDEKKDKYLLVKQVDGEMPRYKVVGRAPASGNANDKVPTDDYNITQNVGQTQGESVGKYGNRSALEAAEYKKANERNKNTFKEMCEEEKEVREKKEQKEVYKSVNARKSNNDMSVPISGIEQKNAPGQPEHPEGKSDPHYRVSLFVRTTVSDHRNQGKKKGGKTQQQYYVTKISPVEKTFYVSPNTSKTNVAKCYEKKRTPNDIEHLYFAQPIDTNDDKKLVPDNRKPQLTTTNRSNNQQFTSDYYETYLEESDKKHTEEKRINVKTMPGNERDDKSKEQQPTCVTPTPPNNRIPQNPKKVEELVYNNTSIDSERKEARRQENVHMTHNQPNAVLSGNTNVPKSLDKPLSGTKHLAENSRNDGYEEYGKENNLVQKVNVYRGQNDPDENVFVIDKTIMGKVGQRDSTDVFVRAKHIEIISPNKANFEIGVDYNLVKSKHPEPQYYVKEPQNKSQPSPVIRQHLSVDQQIKGISQVKQSLEYRDSRGTKVTSCEVDEQQGNRAGMSAIATYEESNQEQASTVTKSHQQMAKSPNSIQGLTKLPNSNFNSLDNRTDLQTIQREKEDVLKYSAIDPQSVIPSAHAKLTIKNPNTEKELKDSPNAPLTNKTNGNLNGPPKGIIGANNANNGGVNSYEYEESASDNYREQTKRVRRVMFKNNQDPNSYNTELLDQTDPTNLVIENKPTQGCPRNSSPDTNHQLPEQKQLTNKERDSIVPQATSIGMERSSNGGVDFEEIVEENEVYTSQTTKERTKTVQVKGEPSYKFPSQRPNVPNNQNSTPTIVIEKVEIPEPHYITRVPKQPLVEYEAYPVDPHQPFEIVTETYGETTSTVKTNKTFMMFKKINGKAVLNQPSVIEPMKISNTGKDATGSFISQKSHDLVPYKNNGQILHKDVPQRVQPSNNATEHYTSYENSTEEENRKYNRKKQFRTNNFGNSEFGNQQEENIPQPKETADKPLQKNQNDGHLIRSPQQPSTSKEPREMMQYEYSETSLVSEQKTTFKEKRVKYNYQRPMINDNDDVEQPLDETVSLEPGVSPAICDDPQYYTRVSTGIWGTEKSRTKIVGTLKPVISVPARPENKERPTEVAKLPNQTVEPVDQHDLQPRSGQYSNEEYQETTNQKHESTKQRYVAVRATLLGGDVQQPGPSGLPTQLRLDRDGAPESDQNRYPDIWDEPTKDLPIKGERKQNQALREEANRRESLRGDYEKSKRKSVTYKNDIESSNIISSEDNNNQRISQHRSNNASPFTPNDGNIVIYIRQPKTQKEQLSPKITVDVGEANPMTSSELENQRVQIHQVKVPPTKSKKTAGKPKLKPRKSKSAEYSRTFSSSTSESGVGSKGELEEERVIDTTHYNLTLKSRTDVELPHGQNAQVKSKSKVKITPIGTGPDIHQGHSPSQCCSADKNEEEGASTDTTLSTPIETGEKRNEMGIINQSPIKINTETSVVKQYPRLQFFNHWGSEGYALLENNGKTLRITYVDDSLPLPCVRGGPLNGEYIFGELHFHWGHKDCCGAEHVIDGHKGTIEAHFLYFKKDYNTAREALKQPDGIAIMAVNLIVGGPPNSLLGELLTDIRLLREADTGAYVPARAVFAWVKNTIDSAKGYFSYKGSLTLEPFVEAVTWLIFPEPIIFCCQQSCEFRKLKSNKGEPLKKNYRLPQPLNNRTVYYVPISVDV